MRFLNAIIAMGLWVWVLDMYVQNHGQVPNNLQVLTVAIVAAGALAGGD